VGAFLDNKKSLVLAKCPIINASAAARGHFNERGVPFSAVSINSMLAR
jgi:hypothetical protein